MTPEEYEKFKEAEKEHLRKLKALKQKTRQLRRQQSVNQALDNMVGGATQQTGPKVGPATTTNNISAKSSRHSSDQRVDHCLSHNQRSQHTYIKVSLLKSLSSETW